MSVEHLRKFGQMCLENKEIHNKVIEIGIKNIEGQIAYSKTLGLDIAEEDLKGRLWFILSSFR